MPEVTFSSIDDCCNTLKLDFSSEEFAVLCEQNSFTPETITAVELVFEYLKKKKAETTVNTLLRLSRLPLKNPKTFVNFDFTMMRGQDVEKLKSLPSLASVYAHRNLAFIGPAGTGKTHLAQAFGYACCQKGLKTYFIKMTELRDRFTSARRSGNEASALNALIRPSCLIIDEVGHCEFDKENTRLFFDMVDRRYNKEGAFNIVFTSNKNPSLWKESFNEDDALLCAMDRMFDDAIVFNIKGSSYRGKRIETVSLQAGRSVTPGSTDLPTT
jgi:DNA replication protein DnaC